MTSKKGSRKLLKSLLKRVKNSWKAIKKCIQGKTNKKINMRKTLILEICYGLQLIGVGFKHNAKPLTDQKPCKKHIKTKKTSLKMWWELFSLNNYYLEYFILEFYSIIDKTNREKCFTYNIKFNNLSFLGF